MKVVFATRNRGKLTELRALVAPLGILVASLDEFPSLPEVVEDGDTFEANALKKARAAMTALGLPALADDSGLEVDALGGAPGVHSARYAGSGHDDAANNAKLIAAMASVEDRRGRFRCALALCRPDGREVVTHGTVEGNIGRVGKGEGGFGYDPLFIVDDTDGRTMAELDADEKNRISHRGRAMAAMVEHLAKP